MKILLQIEKKNKTRLSLTISGSAKLSRTLKNMATTSFAHPAGEILLKTSITQFIQQFRLHVYSGSYWTVVTVRMGELFEETHTNE